MLLKLCSDCHKIMFKLPNFKPPTPDLPGVRTILSRYILFTYLPRYISISNFRKFISNLYPLSQLEAGCRTIMVRDFPFTYQESNVKLLTTFVNILCMARKINLQVKLLSEKFLIQLLLKHVIREQ